MPDQQSFSLGAVLSVTTGRLLAPFGEVHQLLDFMAGEALFTHALPRVVDEAAPAILARYPDLADIVIPDISTQEEADAFLATLYRRFDNFLDLSPMAPEDHTSMGPIEELRLQGFQGPIQVVVVDDEKPEA